MTPSRLKYKKPLAITAVLGALTASTIGGITVASAASPAPSTTSPALHAVPGAVPKNILPGGSLTIVGKIDPGTIDGTTTTGAAAG